MENERQAIQNLLEITEELYRYSVDFGWSGDGGYDHVDNAIEKCRAAIERLNAKDRLIQLLIKALYDWEATEGTVHAEPQLGLELFELIAKLGIPWNGDLSAEQYIENFKEQKKAMDEDSKCHPL